MDAAPEEGSGGWRRGWASAGALIATVLLVALVVMVTLSNRARDDAVAWERHTYEVLWLTRNVDAAISRSEATLARFVLDENDRTGMAYYDEWRRAGRQISQLSRMVRQNPEQRRRVDELQQLYNARGQEFAAAAAAAVSRQQSGGVPFFYQAGLSETGPKLRETLGAIADSERQLLQRRRAETRLFDEQSEKLTEYLGWAAVLMGLGAILLGLMAYSALTDRLVARREADTEANRAMALEYAVQERTRELREANERLRAEAAEREAAEERLRQVQKMEAVGQLTGGIAHDFNNMLAVVVGGLDLAKRKLLGGSKQDVETHLESAMEGASRAAALTRRLLAFSRSDPLSPEGVAPSDLVRGMLDLVDRTIGERIIVHTRFPGEPWHVWADPNQLENAVLNLAVNARDAMEGRGELTLAIDNVSVGENEVGTLQPGEYVRIGVTDTGSGIAPEHLEKVFEPFFTTKPVGKGTGLGLSQIFGFARQSGGDVTIDSTVGIGTTVSIYLPRSIQAAEQAAERQGRPAETQQVEMAPPGMHILLVEDDPRVSRSTQSSLEELGYRVTACEGGREALELMEASPNIELVITDVMMPEMTGPELVRVLAERYPHVGVLFVTGYAGEGEAADLSGYDMLRKPFTVSALAEAVSAASARRASVSPHASASAAAE
ncbi:MAG TPA: ATP-binding protein [Allosphingosinicella sp.]|uniref:hybrid sensor histidine kinase/response regulator n=1 Tax=Allosphingosinicella sp. TaxID=2823234 RepID=UPI002ED98418